MVVVMVVARAEAAAILPTIDCEVTAVGFVTVEQSTSVVNEVEGIVIHQASPKNQPATTTMAEVPKWANHAFDAAWEGTWTTPPTGMKSILTHQTDHWKQFEGCQPHVAEELLPNPFAVPHFSWENCEDPPVSF